MTRLFRTGLYAWVSFSFLYVSPLASQIWGRDVVFTKNWQPLFSGLLFVLFPALHEIAAVVIFLPVLVALLGLYWWRSRLLAVAGCYTVGSFYDVGRFALDGGHNLSWLLLLYNIFLDPRLRPGDLSKFVSMCGFLAIRAQIVLIYLTAGFSKLLAPDWQSGEALYYVLALDLFSFPWMQAWVATAPALLLTGLGYFIIAFQITFPFLVWKKKLRPWVLLVGLSVYAGIMSVMGFVTFGLVMILAHAVFLDEDEARKLRDKVASKMVGKIRKSV